MATLGWPFHFAWVGEVSRSAPGCPGGSVRSLPRSRGVLDLGRAVAGDAAGVVGGVVDQAAGDLAAVLARQATTAPRLNSPSTAVTPIGSRLLPTWGFDRTVVEDQAAGQLQVVGQPLLARGQRVLEA